MPDELLTVAEVAEILKLNQQTIRNWIDAGTLPHIRLGERRIRIKRSDVDAIINREPTSEKAPARKAPTDAQRFWNGEPIGSIAIPGDTTTD